MEQHLDQFLRGVIVLGFAVAGLFFLKFWKKSKERLFALFSIAFFVLSVNRAMNSRSCRRLPCLQEQTCRAFLSFIHPGRSL